MSKDKGKNIKHFFHIEEEFFEIDKSEDRAVVRLEFDCVSDVFDINYMSKTPVMSDDFLDWVQSAFSIIPPKYKIDLDISFGDTEGYTEDELADIFRKNILLEYRTVYIKTAKKNRIAFGLIGIGLAFFSVMMLMTRLWQTESIWRDVFVYVSDIATTVTFWEAVIILVVENKENRAYRRDLERRFDNIRLHGKKA